MVHASGPALALVEVQQNSDTTFPPHDYGRIWGNSVWNAGLQLLGAS